MHNAPGLKNKKCSNTETHTVFLHHSTIVLHHSTILSARNNPYELIEKKKTKQIQSISNPKDYWLLPTLQLERIGL